jgi:hypothetical protein
MMKAIRSSETSVLTRATQHGIREDGILRSNHRESHKSYIVLLSSHLCIGLCSGLFPSGFHTKNSNSFLLSLVQASCPAHPTLLVISLIIFGEVSHYAGRSVGIVRLRTKGHTVCFCLMQFFLQFHPVL